MDRRSMLSSGALVGLGAVAGCATNSDAATDAKTLFSVPQPMLPVAGASEMFPVRRIYCIGRNYAAHAREMGSDPTREPPFSVTRFKTVGGDPRTRSTSCSDSPEPVCRPAVEPHLRPPVVVMSRVVGVRVEMANLPAQRSRQPVTR